MVINRTSQHVIAIGASIAIICVELCACSMSGSERSKRAATAGAYIYRDYCFECHEEKQPGLKKASPNLHGLFAHTYLPDGAKPVTNAAIREIIINGDRTMPAFNGRLTDEQVSDLIVYLHQK